jgi:polar amino acid transport system ATP-binding protein
MSFVHDFADYVVYMDDGRIVEQGPPSMLDNPKTDEFKAFMNKVR